MRLQQRSLDCAPAPSGPSQPPYLRPGCGRSAVFTPSSTRLLRRLPLALLGLALLHLLMGASIGLSVDEAHYLLYAAHPDWSYFDHPPLVGWVQWPLVASGAPVWLLRALPGALWLLSAWGIFHVAIRLPGAKREAGLWALAVFALAPVIHVLGIGLVPDTLLMALGIWTMALTLHMVRQPGIADRRWWLLLGLALGLAGLSKYTAVLLAAPVVLCLLLRHGPGLLVHGRVWAALLLALLLVAPVFWWNAQHGWISFQYQLQHGAGGRWEVLHVLQFVLVQALAYGPLLLAGCMASGVPQAWRWRGFFLIPFAVLAYMAGGGVSLPHWTAPAWVCLAPFAGLVLAQAWAGGHRRAIVALVLLQALICAALLGLTLAAGAPLMSRTLVVTPEGDNPFSDLFGWDAAGERARALAAAHGLASVSVQNWTLASRIGWYAQPLPVHVLDTGMSQFVLWAGELPSGGDTLLVDVSRLSFTPPLGAQGFAACTLLETLPVYHWGAPVARFDFYDCRGWGGKPKPKAAVPGSG